MISKNEIKEIRALGQKKFREERGLFVVEGEKLVEEALRSGFDVVAHYRVEDIGAETMGRISQLTHPSPALAVVRRPAPVDPVIDSDELVLALDGVRDPGNLGTILRIADWFGIRQVLASPDTVECYNPKAVQATMGAIARVRLHYVDLSKSISELPAGVPVYGTFLEGDVIYDTPLSDNGVIIMGNEGNGIGREVGRLVNRKLFIPNWPQGAVTSESLNVAIATAVVCSEFRRRSR